MLSSFNIVYFIRGLTSSPSTRECIKRPLDLRRFWAPDSQQPIFFFPKENVRGMGKSDEAGASKDWGLEKNDRRDGGRKGVMAAHSMAPKPEAVGWKRPRGDGIFLL